MMLRKQPGFTLIELLVVIAIVAIVAALAVPSYQDYVRQSRRADAKAVLMEAAQLLERTYTSNNCYNFKTSSSDCTASAAEATTQLGGLRQSPKDAAAGSQSYDISLSAVASSTFALQAVPRAGGNMDGDACGTFTLTNTGVQGSGGSHANCWQK